MPHRVRLSYLTTSNRAVWNNTIHGMETSLARAGLRPLSVPDGAAWRVAVKALARLRFVRPLFRRPAQQIFVPSMGFSEYRLVPYGYFLEPVPYVFDCWPIDYPRWDAFFRRHRPRVTFFSARDSAAYFRGRIPDMQAIWMPEATDPTEYDQGRPLIERSIDVLELGRRFPAFHEAVTNPLARAGRSHRYEAVPGRIVFPSFEMLVDGLAASRISICFPSSVTHPVRSGSVETVTHRYFESMAARCLIVGQCPGELADLFGYEPVIRGDGDDPAGQILEILDDIGSFQPLVDRNYERLLQVGTWDVRVTEMLTAINGTRLGGSAAGASALR